MSAGTTVQYVDSGDLQIAYQVIGDGPLDILVAFEWGSNLDIIREYPEIERFLQRLGEFGRVIHFDMRGVGLSDPVEHLPPLEDWVDDINAVLSAVGSRRAALIGHGHAGQLCMLYAAMHPDRTAALVLVNAYARLRRAADYPAGFPPEAEEWIVELIRKSWGTGLPLSSLNPGMVEGPRGWERTARLERASGSPRRAVLKQQLAFEIDVRDVLRAIKVPTLILHSRDNIFSRRDQGQYLADHIAGARLVEVAGRNHSPFYAEAHEMMDAIEEFLTGARHTPASDRQLMTVAFTDIVGSTAIAADLGDRRWHSLLDIHETVARREIDAARGTLVKLIGDGLMMTFDGPARAVQCMRSIEDQLLPLGLPIRAGVHTGEVERIGDDIGGIAVHIAARISAMAGAGEVLASSTVRDLVAGSGINFEDRGEHTLKGVPNAWRIFAAH